MFLPYHLLTKELQRKDCWKQYLDYERSLIKREINKCRIDFLEKSIQTNIIPAFLKFRVPNNGCFEPTVVHNFQRRLLKGELNKVNVTSDEHKQKVNDTGEKLRQMLCHTLIASVVLYSRMTVQNIHLEVTSTHQKKLDNLSKQQERPLFNVHDTIRIFELDIRPPKYVLDTLSMRRKNPILDKFNQKELLAEIDLLLNQLGKANGSNDVLNDINVATLKYIKNCLSQRTPKHIITTK